MGELLEAIVWFWVRVAVVILFVIVPAIFLGDLVWRIFQ